MSTAVVATAAAVKASIAVVASTTVASVKSVTAAVATADEAAGIAASVAVTAVAVVAAGPVVATAVITAPTIVAAVEPRAGTDEDAAGEVVRAVVAVRRASVRIVAVVTVGAGGRWPDRAVHRTYSNAHGKLRVGACRCNKQNSQQSNIF